MMPEEHRGTKGVRMTIAEQHPDYTARSELAAILKALDRLTA
jgi:hypothetical protein